MKNSLQTGATANTALTVDRERTIDFMGEKARVYATPMLVRDIEIACRNLLLDEPSMGLAPRLVAEIFAQIAALKAQGTTILLVDQNARAALAIADRGYVMETGRVVLNGLAADLLRDPQVQQAYLGL